VARPALGQLKKDCVTALRILHRQGLSDAFAHLSARLDRRRMLFMPRKSPALVRERDLFVVELERPVPQSGVHQAIYRARADVGAVVHFHSPYVILLSILGQSIRPLHNYSAIFYEGVPTYDSPGQVETAERAAEIAALLGRGKAVVLRGHGAVVVGTSVREACVLSLYLEESARFCVEASKLGEPKVLTREEAERVARQTFKPASNERAWEHFKGLLSAAT
jgi:HCOMODA/2-hydroxy-3-carboxy-muconic semialdehyde decarboxylase